MNISAVVLTKNEEEKIEKCIGSLKFCDEILVIDDNSEDRTVEIVRMLGAKVYKRSLNADFAAQRNFGLKKAKGKWVLFIDADEIITPELANEIVQVVSSPFFNYAGVFLKRADFIWGKRLNFGETGKLKLLRLAKKDSGKWRRKVHEFWDVAGKKTALSNPIFHYPHKNMQSFLYKINRYSSLHAAAKYEGAQKSSPLKIITWPTLKFVVNYIIRLGFLDGIEGFLMAAMMSAHSFLAWSKLWLLQKNR